MMQVRYQVTIIWLGNRHCGYKKRSYDLLTMVNNGSWCLMVNDGQQWLTMVNDGQKRTLICQEWPHDSDLSEKVYVRQSQCMHMDYEGILRRCCLDGIWKVWKIRSSDEQFIKDIENGSTICQCEIPGTRNGEIALKKTGEYSWEVAQHLVKGFRAWNVRMSQWYRERISTVNPFGFGKNLCHFVFAVAESHLFAQCDGPPRTQINWKPFDCFLDFSYLRSPELLDPVGYVSDQLWAQRTSTCETISNSPKGLSPREFRPLESPTPKPSARPKSRAAGYAAQICKRLGSDGYIVLPQGKVFHSDAAAWWVLWRLSLVWRPRLAVVWKWSNIRQVKNG